MKNTSAIGHFPKYTFLPTNTFLETRALVCPLLRVPQSPLVPPWSVFIAFEFALTALAVQIC